MSPAGQKGRGLTPGTAEREALVSAKAFTFAHGVNPSTGEVTDVRCDIRGSKVGGKVLFYPFGKWSTTASAWFLETVRQGNHPVAIVTEGVDLSAVIGSVMAKVVYGREIPVIGEVPRGAFSKVAGGATVEVAASTGEVKVSP